MSNVKIYHNPRCSKSRQALQIIKDHGIEPKVIEYLKEPLGKSELENIAKSLGLRPREFVEKMRLNSKIIILPESWKKMMIFLKLWKNFQK